MIQLRHRQPSLWHSGLAKDIEDLWEPWMKEVDQLLENAVLVESAEHPIGPVGKDGIGDVWHVDHYGRIS